MKIAFVGKGGSGKSTVTALFTHYLTSKKQRVLAVDADINQHLAPLLGVPFDAAAALSSTATSDYIKQVLSGDNRLVDSVHMVKTTPPGRGSHLIGFDASDPILARCSVSFASGYGHFMHVGTYDEEGIGTSCYHGNLAVFENIVSHTDTHEDEWLVADMVAGTDAFAGALYLMFDAIVLVVEPTPESVGVHRQFMRLAESAGVAERVLVAANKVADADDTLFLAGELGVAPSVVFDYDADLKRARQRGKSVSVGSHEPVCRALEATIRAVKPDKNARLRELHRLHEHYVAQDYVKKSHGDLSGQIDSQFSL